MMYLGIVVPTLLILAVQPSSAFSHQPTALNVHSMGSSIRAIKSESSLNFRSLQNEAYQKASPSSSSLRMTLQFPRGGGALLATQSAEQLFNSAFGALAFVAVAIKVAQKISDSASKDKSSDSVAAQKPAAVKSLQVRFLLTFWMLRCADWLQGPYFYDVYRSKIFNGVPASLGLISKIFVAGFASTALFGPSVGRFADTSGRKKGTLAFCALYTMGALSTKSSLLTVLLMGRVLNGIGTSLLFSAPEAWLVGEAQDTEGGGDYLGETFGLAYAGDSIVAILAGKFSGMAASRRGPSGPFELSTVFLALGALFTAFLWKENVAPTNSSDDAKPSIRDAVEVIKSDSKIMLVGATQALFEAAMYIFVLQWPPALTTAIAKAFPNSVAGTPYGTIFSCFMACCLLGSTAFGQLVNKMSVKAENFMAGMLSLATLAMGAATLANIRSMSTAVAAAGALSPGLILGGLTTAFFLFEACVGMYFPSIGTLRSRYVPDSHRSVIMNLFGIPLNALVVIVFLINERLGVTGALGISTGALGLASLCMMKLRGELKKSDATAVAA